MRAKETCEAIISKLIEDGFRYQVTIKDIEKTIMQIRGIDERTVARWLKALVYFEYLLPSGINVYKINPLQVPELMKTLKNNKQIKLT